MPIHVAVLMPGMSGDAVGDFAKLKIPILQL